MMSKHAMSDESEERSIDEWEAEAQVRARASLLEAVLLGAAVA